MSDPNYRPHAAHPGRSQREKSSMLTIDTVPDEQLPSYLLQSESAYVRAMLEELDDVIFSAVGGDAKALQQAQTLWPEVVAAIGWQLVEESREQYLRFAIDMSQKQLDGTNQRTPENAVAALEIISLLAK